MAAQGGVTRVHEGEESVVDTKTVILLHSLRVPVAVFDKPFPIVSRWFTCPECSAEGMHWRIYVSGSSSSPGSSGRNRSVSVQMASKEEMLSQFAASPYLDSVPPNHTPRQPRYFLLSADCDWYVQEQKKGTVGRVLGTGILSTINLIRLGHVYFYGNETEDRTLKVRIELAVMNNVQRTPTATGQHEYCLNLLKRLLSDAVVPDVKVCVGEGTIMHAHRAVLAASSRVFKAMFQHDTVEKKDGVIKVKDVSPEVFRLLLGYVYTGQVESEDPEVYTALLPVADRYHLKGLMEACEDFLVQNPPTDLLRLLMIADSHNAATLKKAALEALISQANAINDATLKELMKTHPSLVADLLSIKFSSTGLKK